MVATTFAGDTPLAVTQPVFKGRIAGCVPAWALYFGIPINCIVLGWVNLAMVKILIMVLGVDKLTALGLVLGLIAITALILTLSGLWGFLVTDAVQFLIKMRMVIVLAFSTVGADGAGGVGALSGFAGPGDGLYPRDDRSLASAVAGFDVGWIPGSLYVDDRYKPELGRELSGERFLPQVLAARSRGERIGSCVTVGDSFSDADVGGGDLQHGFDYRGVEVVDRNWRGDWWSAAVAMVLVADQCMERGKCDGDGVYCERGVADGFQDG